MRIEIKPPSPAPTPLRPGALLTVRVEAADPAALLSGPPTVAYEGRYDGTAFLFPADNRTAPSVSTATSAASDFRTPLAPTLAPYVDIPLHEGDVVTATLTTPPPNANTYNAAFRAPAAPLHPNQAPVVLQLAEGASTPTPPPPPTPQPAPGLTITPSDPDQDVLTLDPAPGNDNIVVVN